MDPTLFGINGDVVFELLAMIVIISMFVERPLSVIFGWRLVAPRIEGRGIKEPIALVLGLVVVWYYKIDAMAILLSEPTNSWPGYFITAGIIAGGSKGSIKLFRDFLGWRTSTEEELKKLREQGGQP